MHSKTKNALNPITLSKGRFITALDCPRKLDYMRDARYHDSSTDNELLKSLAEGGYQVGELARRMFPDGILIDAPDVAAQAQRTSELLKQKNVTLFEPTIRHGNLLVRVDILEKKGNKVRLLEVKAKGFHPGEDRFLAKRGAHPILSGWRPYLLDVAYQAHVLQRAYPDFRITPFLVLLDKRQAAAFDGLNGMFAVHVEGRNVSIRVADEFDIQQLNPPLLVPIDVSQEVQALRMRSLEAPGFADTFEGFIDQVSGVLAAGESFPVVVGAHCKDCQFYVDPAEAGPDKRSGWSECLRASANVPADTRRDDTVFSLHRFGSKKLEKHLSSGKRLVLADLLDLEAEDDLSSLIEITYPHRRALQVGEAKGVVVHPFMLDEVVRLCLPALTQPVHFLDFETARPALPYHRGRVPYDLVLFQYSHHVLDEKGRIRHFSQFLQTDAGTAPSLDTLRALQQALSGDDFRIVHWSPYEASVLKEIRRQIEADPPADAAALLGFIDSLVGDDETPGRLYDLAATVRRTVFFPGTGGSSSIKRVLPAVLRHSKAVRDSFKDPVYGTSEMPSLNFRNWNWIRMRGAEVVDPYELLDPLFDQPALEHAVRAADDEDPAEAGSFIANGGAALLAYDQLQRRNLPAAERARLNQQLLRYCELDTLAMVMVFLALQASTAIQGSRT